MDKSPASAGLLTFPTRGAGWYPRVGGCGQQYR